MTDISRKGDGHDHVWKAWALVLRDATSINKWRDGVSTHVGAREERKIPSIRDASFVAFPSTITTRYLLTQFSVLRGLQHSRLPGRIMLNAHYKRHSDSEPRYEVPAFCPFHQSVCCPVPNCCRSRDPA